MQKLTVRAKGKLLLENAALTVAAGRRYGLVGPNVRAIHTHLSAPSMHAPSRRGQWGPYSSGGGVSVCVWGGAASVLPVCIHALHACT